MAGILEYSKTPSSNTAVNSIGIQGTNSISNFDNAMRQMMADTASGITRHVEKATGSYTAVKADFNQLWRATGAVTVNLTAAATLTDGWCIWLKADGGAITVDPNSSEQINGAATLSLPDGFSAFVVCNGTAFFAIVFGNGDVTIDGTQTLTNKTLTSPTINNPTLILKQGTSPAPTTEGDMQWDTDDNRLVIGDGAAAQTFSPNPASTAQGDIEYYTAANTKARLAKGTANQVLAMNSGATAPEWVTQTIDYGAGNAALSYGAIGTYVLGFIRNGGFAQNSTIAGSSLQPAGFLRSSGSSSSNDESTAANYTKGGTALSGTWRTMGRSNANSGSDYDRVSLFMRIS